MIKKLEFWFVVILLHPLALFLYGKDTFKRRKGTLK